MRRRALLQRLASGSALAVGGNGAVAAARAHPGTRGSKGTDAEPSGTGIGPHSRLGLDEAREAVVGPDGTTVYVATMTGFSVVDVSDAHDPTVVATVDGILADHEDGPLENVQDLKVDGDRLLVVGPAQPGFDLSAAVVYDVTEAESPERVGTYRTNYPIHNAFLSGDVAYLTANGADGNRLETIEVGAEPTELGRWSLLEHDDAWADVAPSLRVLHDVWVHEDLAYLAHWDAGTWILDVSDPADPAFVARVRGRDPDVLPTRPAYAVLRESVIPPGNDHYVTTNADGTLLGIGSESWAFQGSSGPSGITFYDVSEPTAPVERGRIDPPPSDDPSRGGVWTTAHNFELVDDYCYAAWYQGGVTIHDVGDPSAPVEEYRWRESDAARFWTARLAVEGESFVAPSMGVPPADGGTPTNGDKTPEPPVAAEPTGGGTQSAEAGTGTDERDGRPALYVFPDVVHEAPESMADPSRTGEPTGGIGSGFGVGATLAGAVGLGALWARRRRWSD